MPNPRYRDVADELRGLIASGAMSSSGAFPTEAQLSSEHRVSRSTVRKALGLLRDEGWVEARQGSGWSVPLSRRGKQFGSFRLAVTTDPSSSTTSSTLGHDRRRPPPSVAGSLATDRRHRLLVVERLTTSGPDPIHRSETWFSPTISRDLDTDRAETEPPARLLAEVGPKPDSFDQYAEAVLADDLDRELLGVGRVEAILQVVRTAFGIDGSPLFQSIHRHPGPLARLDIDFPTTDQSDGLFVGLHRADG